MTIDLSRTVFVSPAATIVDMDEMLSITAGNNPTFLTIFAFDRNEYTVEATGDTGNFTGNGNIESLGTALADGETATITFTLQPNNRYYSSVYGYLDQLIYNSSASFDDITNISIFASDSATNVLADYLGSATVSTQPNFTGTVPTQATPLSIEQAAASFVGQAWNMNGCWILTSSIAADAGASVSLTSTFINIPGLASGEWIVAFNGPAGQTGDWQSMVTAGEMIDIATPDGGGHITTCVSGSGASAMLIDNITYVYADGTVANSAYDGSPNDIVIAPPHPASQEWAGVDASSVVIYELDCPIVTDIARSFGMVGLTSEPLSSLFNATDPGTDPITSWQVYNSAADDTFVVNGVDYQDHTAASALTCTSLASVSLLAGQVPTTDVIEARAYNGSYWGDWQKSRHRCVGAPDRRKQPSAGPDQRASCHSSAGPSPASGPGATHRPAPSANRHGSNTGPDMGGRQACCSHLGIQYLH